VQRRAAPRRAAPREPPRRRAEGQGREEVWGEYAADGSALWGGAGGAGGAGGGERGRRAAVLWEDTYLLLLAHAEPVHDAGALRRGVLAAPPGLRLHAALRYLGPSAQRLSRGATYFVLVDERGLAARIDADAGANGAGGAGGAEAGAAREECGGAGEGEGADTAERTVWDREECLAALQELLGGEAPQAPAGERAQGQGDLAACLRPPGGPAAPLAADQDALTRAAEGASPVPTRG
jgi:hypothetical protein